MAANLAVGVLALQGDVDEHVAALGRAGAQAIAVKNRAQDSMPSTG